MYLFGRTILTGLVWLTAGMTLLAGYPRFECRCPNGQVKAVCLGSASESSPCCCGGACCSHAPGDQCCCHASSTPSDGDADRTPCCGQPDSNSSSGEPLAHGSGHLTGSSCAKTLAQTTKFTVGDHKKATSLDLSAETVLTTLTERERDQVSLRTNGLVPPTDLITVLQRLLI